VAEAEAGATERLFVERIRRGGALVDASPETRLAAGDVLAVSGVTDALSAKVVAAAGFDAIWLGSLLGTASFLGNVDVGLMGAGDRLDQLRKIRAVCDLPVVVDGEEGWGDAPQVAHWVREFARAGANGIMIDDKSGDFMTPYIGGTGGDVLPVEVAVRKYRAALDARPSAEFLVVARSGARRVHGLDEQIRRLAAYKEAGVDVLWATSSDAETLRRHRAELSGPLWAVCNEHSGAQGRLTLDEFRALGVQVVGYELPVALVGLRAMVDAARELREAGSIAPLLPRMASFKEFLALAGFDEMAETARRYGVIPA
jgi:2-methylisocitrate lyase-like PEP mutase family enzyme